MAKNLMDKGELVPDELISRLLKEFLKSIDYKNGFILDGFPRTLEQCTLLDDIFEELSLAISFSESEKNWSEEHQPLFIFKADFNLDLIYKTDSGWNYDDFSDTILGGYHKIKTYNNAENLNGFVIN